VSTVIYREVKRPLRERLGERLIEWAHRFRREAEEGVYCYSTPRDGVYVRHEHYSPARGFLVYGSCACGWWCACPEGGIWPQCPNCGKQVLPPPGEFGNPHGRMGFVTHFMDETEAVKRECP
jgi:hypothetical protein